MTPHHEVGAVLARCRALINKVAGLEDAETLLTSLAAAAVEFHLGVMIQISELSFRGAVYGLPKGHYRSHVGNYRSP